MIIALMLVGMFGQAGQVGASATAPTPVPPPPPAFAGRRPLDGDDYRRKNEGGYVTGLPIINYDSNFGYGGGGRVYYYWDGWQRDPLFAYTPYLHRVFLQAFATTGGLQFHYLDYDVPSILGTPFRWRSQLIFIRNTASHYFGLGARALAPLSYPGAPGRTYSRFDEYQAALDQVGPGGSTWGRYNQYDLTRPLLIFGVERSLLRGLVRTMVGVGLNHFAIRRYGGDRRGAAGGVAVEQPTRLDEDCAPPARIVGCAGGWDNYLRLGLALDTRDFEPDPNRGIFADAAFDLGTGALGSEYTWRRVLVAVRGYLSVAPEPADVVLAARLTFEAQSANTPFFEMSQMPYTDDPHDGLGGVKTMRGFQQDRFVGPAMVLGNLELRWTFSRFEVWRQKMALIAVPFLDAGTVADGVSSIDLGRVRWDYGGALRISWNLATVATIEYGRSAEDHGVYVNVNHTF